MWSDDAGLSCTKFQRLDGADFEFQQNLTSRQPTLKRISFIGFHKIPRNHTNKTLIAKYSKSKITSQQGVDLTQLSAIVEAFPPALI